MKQKFLMNCEHWITVTFTQLLPPVCKCQRAWLNRSHTIQIEFYFQANFEACPVSAGNLPIIFFPQSFSSNVILVPGEMEFKMISEQVQGFNGRSLVLIKIYKTRMKQSIRIE